jgi:hypothetical protein
MMHQISQRAMLDEMRQTDSFRKQRDRIDVGEIAE